MNAQVAVVNEGRLRDEEKKGVIDGLAVDLNPHGLSRVWELHFVQPGHE